MNCLEINEKAYEIIREALHKEPDSISSVEKTEEGWCVEVEILEKKSIPETFDLLKIFEFFLDEDGKVQSFKLLKRKQRGD
jgi:hypothetical protein